MKRIWASIKSALDYDHTWEYIKSEADRRVRAERLEEEKRRQFAELRADVAAIRAAVEAEKQETQ